MTKPNKTGGGHKPKPEHNVHVGGGIQAHTPPEEQKKHDTEREEDTTHRQTERDEDVRREFKKVWIEGFTLLAVIIYAFLTWWQGSMTREVITNSVKQFQINQRPYLWNSNVTNPTNVKIVVGQRMWMNISLLNFGKAPALNAKGIAKIFIGDNAMQDANNWFAAFGEKVLPDNPSETGIVIPPGIPSGEITEKTAFGGGGYFTAMSDNVLKQNDVDYILHTNETVAIVVHMQYFDAYGIRYWSNFCLTRFDSGVYPNCQKHNEMH